jgi:hypothetical protein
VTWERGAETDKIFAPKFCPKFVYIVRTILDAPFQVLAKIRNRLLPGAPISEGEWIAPLTWSSDENGGGQFLRRRRALVENARHCP